MPDITLRTSINRRASRYSLPYQSASFRLVVDTWTKRYNRDFLYGRHSGNAVQVPLLLDSDGNNPIPLEWFEDGTPASEGGLRFAMTKEHGYAGFRFGSYPRDASGQEIVGPHLRPAVQRILNWRIQLGPLQYDIGSIIGPRDPYYFLVSPRLGTWTRKAMPSMYPRFIFGAYGELLGRPEGEYRFSEFAWLVNRNYSNFDQIFSQRAHAEQHAEFAWTGLNGLSTPTAQTGPSENTNTSAFVYVDSSSATGVTAALPRIQESGRMLDMDMAPGTNRRLTLEFSCAGVAFRFPDSGLKLYEYSTYESESVVSGSDTPSQTHHWRGWPYTAERQQGDQVAGYGNGNNFTVSRAGGWREETVLLADDTTRVVLQPSWENDATSAPIEFGDVAIRSITVVGDH